MLEGLKRLEYRGYDSAGVAFLRDSRIEVRRSKGKIKELASMIDSENPHSTVTIGQTRWATHGRPSDENAHPHRSDGIVLVHNGIIENYLPLKQRLTEKGYRFTSETDTEVLCHLIAEHSKSLPFEDAVRKALAEVKGTYALAVMKEDDPDKIIAVRKDSPLVVGLGDGEFFIASDPPAFLSYSSNVIFLDDGEMVALTKDGIKITGLDGIAITAAHCV